jgi:hypothetical protein
MASLAIGLGTSIIGGVISSRGQKSAAQAQQAGQQEGIAEQARIEQANREFQQRQFDKQIERQQPFVDVGEMALAQLPAAISNRGDASQLPATQIQAGLISDFLGPNAPGFVQENALENLNAIEAERNKGRLSDLVNIGLGGVGSTAGSRLNLGTTLGQSLATSGLREGLGTQQSLQQAAVNRQNRQNQIIGGLSGLPSLIFEGLPRQQASPLITRQNPLGLTPGAGL